MSALGTIEAGSADNSARQRRQILHLVTEPSAAGDVTSGPSNSGLARPNPSSGAPAGARDRSRGDRVPAAGDSKPAPLRLTRRGRIVVAVLAVVLATVVITIVSMAVAGGAQASNHGKPRAGYQGLHQIVVEPGQTLWSLAAQAEPTADPRLVVAQIMAVNSLTSTVIEAGEVLWVPR